MRGGYASLAEAQAELGKVKGRIRTGVFQMHGITGRMWFTERIASKIDLRPNTLRLSQQHIDRYLIPPSGAIAHFEGDPVGLCVPQTHACSSGSSAYSPNANASAQYALASG